MAEVQIAYGEDGSIIIGKPVSGCWYAVADVLDVFPYGTGEFLREVIQEKSVAVILDQGSFGGNSDRPEDFEKVLWGQNKSVTLTYMVDHCVMTYQDVQHLFSLCGARAKQIKNMLETARVVTDGDAVTASLREQLAEARKEVSSLRIQIQMGQKKLEEKNDAFQKLLTENKQIDAENEKLKARIVELEKASQNGAESEEIASLPTNIKTVLRMLQEQKSDREIAQALYNGGGNSGMSQAQVKALLWRGDEFPAEQSIKNAMKELFLPAGKSTL